MESEWSRSGVGGGVSSGVSSELGCNIIDSASVLSEVPLEP